MAKFRQIKTSLTGGEISPTAQGRIDLPSYASSCKTLKNMIPMLSGGAYRRPGTMYQASVGASTAHHAPALIPFVASQSEAYAIAIGKAVNGAGYVKSYLNISDLVQPSSATASLLDNTSTFTAVAATDVITHSISNLYSYRTCLVSNSGGALPAGLSANTRYYVVYQSATTIKLSTTYANAVSGTFIDLTTNGTGTNTITLMDAVPYQPSLFTDTLQYYDEWHEVQYAQSADILTIVHPNRMPHNLVRNDINDFSFRRFDYGLSGADLRDAWPYLEQDTSGAVMTPDAPAATVITCSQAFFDPGHVGSVIKMDKGGTIGAARIMGYTSSTSVQVSIIVNFGAGAQDGFWQSAWSDYQGWPRSICYFADRRAFGGTTGSPDSIWFSESSDYDQMSVSTILLPKSEPTTTQPFTLALLSQQLNVIQWMSPERTLAVGTLGDEWLIESETGASFGADDSTAKVQSRYGSSYNQGLRIGNELIFAQKSEQDLRAFIFNFQEDSFVGEPLNVLYDEFPFNDDNLTVNGNRKIRNFVWDQSRSTLWCIDTTGRLRGLTRERRLGVNTWHSHELGGYDANQPGAVLTVGSDSAVDPNTLNVTGSLCSITVIPNKFTNIDDVWMVVKRYVNSVMYYYIEKFHGKNPTYSSALLGSSSSVQYPLTDCSVYTLSDSPTTPDDRIFSGLDHLEGETPVGTARSIHGWFYVTGNAIVSGDTTVQSPEPSGLDSTLVQVFWGYNYDSVIEPVRLEAGSQVGSSQGAIKKIHKLTLRFYNTMACKAGRDANNLETIVFRESDTPLIQSAEFFTGDKLLRMDSDYDREGYIYVLQDRPLPFALISIIAEGVTFD